MSLLNFKHLRYFWVVAKAGVSLAPASVYTSLRRRSAGK